jgi:hypothetical protein
VRRRGADRAATSQAPGVQTLVLSQHEAVRRQLVSYLGRSPALVVHGEPFTPEAILRARPDALVLDLSQVGNAGLRAAIDATRCVGAKLIALASMCEPADEQTVLEAGGIYRLKSAGADGLAELIQATAGPIAPSSRG